MEFNWIRYWLARCPQVHRSSHSERSVSIQAQTHQALEHELPGSRTIAMFATPRASDACAVNAILGPDYRFR
jgi:hypothetical protein